MKRSISLKQLLIGSTVLLLALATATICSSQGIGWALVNWKVRHDFPDLRRIQPQQVADWLNDKTRSQPVLLDVRTKAEYDVSHIHGAQRVQPDSGSDAVKLNKDQPIVTYCSVGYRSGAFAKKLQDAGYKKVENMAGSIFQWANEGRPVERDGHRVDKVHPYNRTWGKLLNPELRADIPANGPGI